MSSGKAEFFDAGAHGCACGPDVVKEDVSDARVEWGVTSKGIGVFGLGKARSAISADLGGVTGTC